MAVPLSVCLPVYVRVYVCVHVRVYSVCPHSSLFVVGVMRALIALFTLYVFAFRVSYECERGN